MEDLLEERARMTGVSGHGAGEGGERRWVVALTARLPTRVEAELGKRFDLRIVPGDGAPSREALARALASADGLVCTVTDRVPESLFTGPPFRTRIVANFGAGVNHLPLAAMAQAGVVVTNTPDQLTEATADLTLGLMLMTLRRLGEGERMLRDGRWTGWRPTDFLGHDLHGRRLGLVGFGRIGQAVARRAIHGFGMTVRYYTRRGPVAGGPAGAEPVTSLDALLADAEVVSLHLPALPGGVPLLDAQMLGRLRPGSWLINTARGSLVDEAGLVECLESGHLAGAGLDVFAEEPAVHPGLAALPNVVLLPHMGSATVAAREAMGMSVVASLAAFFDGRPVPHAVMPTPPDPGASPGC